MINKKDNNSMGKRDIGWLKSTHHFSFADYFSAKNMNYGVLRVLTDGIIKPNNGFPSHPHQDMEVITYVIDGGVVHRDSKGNEHILEKGGVQAITAGTGVYHSEYNEFNKDFRALQIWIYPDKHNYKPSYEAYQYPWSDRENKWLHVLSAKDGTALTKINQDVNMYALSLDAKKEINFSIEKNRQVYLVQIEGSSLINGVVFNNGDALEGSEDVLEIVASEKSHILLIEMKKSIN
ncbi:pirin family protein [uncultured Clostridium sp.]|uniref:pirin family protein n=1 Tax=uncultured Clostridium sp. TaxID=59620 RepID=UPI00260CB491|nr:pirin family protein [uncultured Clostridium sp.]